MIPKIAKRGTRTRGLLAYLYGPGKRDEHVDPHLVAAWEPEVPDPGRNADTDLTALAELLDQPVRSLPRGRAPDRHVWHCSVRTSPEDRNLGDAEWADIARRMVASTGIAPAGDEAACRWVAVRHAEDHIHIVATLVREDGRRPRLFRDADRAQGEARQIEADLGLRRLHPGDGTAAKWPTSAERAKADRQRRERPSREILREAVRQAVAGARSEAEFLNRLEDAGLRVSTRAAPSGDLLGYRVAVPGDRNAEGQPVWFPGSKLAPDLSLPKVRERICSAEAQGHVPPSNPDRTQAGDASAPSAARLQAAEELWAIHAGSPPAVAAAGELVDGLAATAPLRSRHETAAAARAFERATRAHARAAHSEAAGLRRAARRVATAGPAMGTGQDGAATAVLLSALTVFVLAASRWHNMNGHHQQAAAARQAAHHIRAAYNLTVQPHFDRLTTAAQKIPPARLAQLVTVLRENCADAEKVLTEPGWPVLAATLDQLDAAGTDSAAELTNTIASRELDSADSVSEVIAWRLRHKHNLVSLQAPEERANTPRINHTPQPAESPTARLTPRQHP